MYRILELIHSLPHSSNAVLKEMLIFDKIVIATFIATIVYRVSWLYARAILCFEAELGVETSERRAIVTRPLAAQRAMSSAGARPLSAYLILSALVRFLGFARLSVIVASEVSTPARSKSSS